MDELLILQDCGCVSLPNNIGANANEMLLLYKEEFPFFYISTIDGECIQWDIDFINKCLNAMATGSLANFSDIEKQVWKQFVEFQDLMSHSATTDTLGAIGCTIPNSLGQSFVVTSSGVTTTLCQDPETSVAKESQSKSLDSYFMDLYNCQTVNDCGIITGTVTDISPCPIV